MDIDQRNMTNTNNEKRLHAYKILENLMNETAELKPTHWCQAMMAHLAACSSNSGKTYKEFCEELDKSREYFKVIFRRNEE